MAPQKEPSGNASPKLEIVVKCDSAGSVEAVTSAISNITSPRIGISVIHSGIGAVNKSDVLLAGTGSALIAGFQVEALPGMDKVLKEHNVEVRLYNVIYTLTDDLRTIAESMLPSESQEEVLGSAKVIATFKSVRRGIIVGCEVLDGSFAQGQRFRIISAMGPVYSGIIESMHIADNTVQKITRGQQAGIKVRGFNKVKIGDFVESFRPVSQKTSMWRSTGKIIRK